MLPVAFGHQHVRTPVECFPLAVHPWVDPAARALGVTTASSALLVGDQLLDARFAWWRLTTLLSNIAGVTVEPAARPWWATGVRVSGDRGLTVDADPTAALVRIAFHRPVGALDPSGALLHPWLAVATATPAELADSIRTLSGCDSPTPSPISCRGPQP